jgi:dUTP pyrophosphatase
MRGFYYVKDECAVSNAKSRAIPLPSRGTTKAAGYDFYSPNDFVIEPGQTCMIWTDIKAFFSEDEVLKIYPRSSMSVQRNLVLKNTVGIIDSDYRGEWMCIYTPIQIGSIVPDFPYNVGDRVAQFYLDEVYNIAFLEVKALSDTNRGEGGFGSTGLK